MPPIPTALRALALTAMLGTPLLTPAHADVVSKWSFENNLSDTAPAGGTTDNLSGAALNGPLNTAYVPGIVGQAVQVGEGAGDATVLSAPDSNDLDLAPSFTVEAFVYRTVEHGQDWERFATKWFDGSTQWHWAFRGPPGRSQDLFMNGGQQINQGSVTADIGLGEWHHVAMTGDPANGLRLWQNGAVVGSAPYLAPAGGGDSFRIGNAAAGQSGLQFSGWVDEFQIHDVSQDLPYMIARAALISGAPAITSFTADPAVVAEGENSLLSWTVVDADTLTLDGGGFNDLVVTGQTSALATNLTQTTAFTLTATNAQGSTDAQVLVGVGVNGAGPFINEFLAINDGGHEDEDGDDSDWIEIFNPGASPAILTGWYLTDDPADLTKWQFPATSVPSVDYLVVFASNKNRALAGSELHTNFRLSGDGEYLALVMPDGTTVANEFSPTFPAQQSNVSFGYFGDPPLERPLFPPTPDAANTAPAGPIITSLTENPNPAPGDADPIVVEAAIVPVAFPITSVTLRYRVNFGPESTLAMSESAGGIYTATIPAAASGPGDVVRWRVVAEDTSAASTTAPSFVDPAGSPEYHGAVIADPATASALPVLHWYVENTAAAETSSGTRASLYFNGEFYDNVFVRIRGDTARNWPKKSYKFDFNDGHHFRFDPALPRVDEINVNTTFTDKSYVRTFLSYESFRDAGSPYSIAFPLRVEQNGVFYSVAQFVEQADRDYLRRNGLDDEGALYKAKSNGIRGWGGATPATSGIEKKNRRHEDFSDLQSLIDNLALNGDALGDYLFDNVNIPAVVNNMATNAVIQNIDRTVKNYYLYRDTEGSGEWMIFPWDVDLAFGPDALNTNTIVTSDDNASGSSHPYMGTSAHTFRNLWNGLLDAMVDRPETREMLLRRIRTLGDAMLNTTYYEDRIDQLVADLGPDVALDRARWGGNAHFGGTTLSLQGETDRIVNEYLVGRRSHLFVTHASTVGSGLVLVPEATAPVTALVPTDGSLGDTWKLTAFDDSGWLSGTNAVGYERGSPPDYAPLLGIDLLSPSIPAAMRIDADGNNVNDTNSCYVRYEFDVADKSAIAFLRLRVKYDDGFVAYLNGTRVMGENDPATPLWNSAATTQHADSQATVFEDFDITSFKGSLVDGANVLAVHALNNGSTSSDMLLSCELLDAAPGGGGGVGIPPTQPAAPSINFGAIEFNPASGNQDEEFVELINPNAFSVDISGWTLSGGVSLTLKPGTVIPAGGSLYLSPDVSAFRARGSFPKGGEGHFVQGSYGGHLSNFGEPLLLSDDAATLISQTTSPVAPSDAQLYLVVSELMYHPAGDPGEEFIELLNISDSVTLDLSGVKFAAGVEFDFTGSAVTSLAPGARVLVVRNQAAFEAVHGAGLPVAGEFANASVLDNDGEEIKLDDATNSTIREFTYNDKSPWPESADGAGPSLVLIDPAAAPDHDVASNWRLSTLPGGNPNSSDAVAFFGDPDADLDDNGVPDLIDHALTDDGLPVLLPAADGMSFEFIRDLAADDMDLALTVSSDLVNWSDGSAIFSAVSTEYLGTGGLKMIYSAAAANLPAGRIFVRIEGTLSP